MIFKDSKAIYLQISDEICNEILSGNYAENERITSVREYAAMLEVNPNTVMRSYDMLQQQNIIFNKRGIGYFVSRGAIKIIKQMRKDSFLKNDVNDFFQQIYSLNIPKERIMEMYDKFVEKMNKKNK
jgi:GntR family transcriptional regulator